MSTDNEQSGAERMLLDLLTSVVKRNYISSLRDYEKTKGKFFCMELRAYGETGEAVWTGVFSQNRDAFQKFLEGWDGKDMPADLYEICEAADKYFGEAQS